MTSQTEETCCQNTGCPPQDFQHIVGLVREGASVLDLGCGNGELLLTLSRERHVRAQGLELSEQCLQACVARGLHNVVHGDLDEGLADYEDQSVDYVLLTNTLQVLHRPLQLLKEMGRVGRQCLISVPNFAHWKARSQLFFGGRMPKTARLPYEWYDTPNIHLTTLADFRDLYPLAGLRLIREIPLRTTAGGQCVPVHLWPNLLAEQGLFLLESETQ